jgi:AraC-like DNA-binding protein
MPHAPAIRKEILQALENHIIPALYARKVSLGNVTLPFRFTGGISTHLVSKTVPRPGINPFGYPVQTFWPKAELHSIFSPYIGFVYQGSADEHTIVSASQAAKHQQPKGEYAIRWNAPSILFFPPGTPHNSGARPFWDGPAPPPPAIKILWLTSSDPLLAHLHTEPVEVPHSLRINDQVLITLTKVFCQEIQSAPGNNPHTAQAVFLAMMLRLQQHLLIRYPRIANTSYPPLPLVDNEVLSEQARKTCQNAAIFIQMHLREQLTCALIAQRTGLSAVHLNRLFHQFSGVPVMRYVRLQRITAAKKILESDLENITEIATLVGFGSIAAFCRAFLRETGLTPNQFRRQMRQSKSTF